MALVDLKSDLSYYGKNPGPYKPPTSITDTKFKGFEAIPYVETGGYEYRGAAALGPVSRFAGDSFTIDTGTSSRKAQLGAGYKFPIGPEGQIHQFDKTRIGYTGDSKYGDQYGVKFNDAGLADTYTANSPIDDMYNKFNLRDDATPNPGYAKQPFILRGIQRAGSSDPQRWGLGNTTAGKISSTFDIPRGGILMAGERALIDTARLAKFLISPRGIGYALRQVGYQLMNPNVEGVDGKTRKPIGKNSPKLWTPINTMLNPIANLAGLHVRRSGLLPVDLPGDPHNYEDVILKRDGDEKISNNRLVKLTNDLMGDDAPSPSPLSKIAKALGIGGKTEIELLSGKTGPQSILGIGSTSINRYQDSTFKKQKETGLSLDTWHTDGPGYHRWFYGKGNYEKTRGESGIKLIETLDDEAESLNKRVSSKFAPDTAKQKVGPEPDSYETKYTNEEAYIKSKGQNSNGKQSGATTTSDADNAKNSLKNKYTEWPQIAPDRGGRGDVLPGGGINEREEGPSIDDYKRMAYGDIPKGRIPPKGKQTNHFDFRTKGKSQEKQIGWGDPKIDVIDDSIDKSLIKFIIGGIKFKAYLGSLNDAFAPGWNGQADQGRADSRYLYESFERTISTDFIVPIMKKGDRATIWGNLQKLAQKTYPVYGSSGFHGQTVKVTIGDMYVKKDMIITDLSYDWDNETPWEIDDGHQAPMYTNVSISFTVLGEKPTSGTTVYSNI